MVFKTNNPLEYNQVDGMVADETAPAPQVQSVGVGTAIIVGLFSWGPTNELSKDFARLSEIQRIYMDTAISGMDALRNKSYSSLKVVRALVADSVAATKTFQDVDPKDTIVFTGKYKGVMGNSIQVKIEDGTTTGKKYTVKLDDSDNVSRFPQEIYDDVELADVAEAFLTSKLVTVALDVAADTEPEDAAFTALAAGSNGTAVDTDYETAIKLTESEGAGNVVFLDVYTVLRNGYLKASMATTQDKMAILGGSEAETVAEAIAAVETLRDTEGRLIYAFNWLETTIRGAKRFMSPASFYASIVSNIGPHIDPAYAGNAKYLYGVSDIKNKLSRNDFINLNTAGVSSFEFVKNIGFNIKSGIVTQVANSEKVMILRRRMSDFLIESHYTLIRNYQNDVNSLKNRKAIQGGMYNFIENNLEKNNVLPKDSEVEGGLAKIVDIESLNDDISIGQGFNYILYKQRIYSSMRWIVLKIEVGTGTVVEA